MLSHHTLPGAGLRSNRAGHLNYFAAALRTASGHQSLPSPWAIVNLVRIALEADQLGHSPRMMPLPIIQGEHHHGRGSELRSSQSRARCLE